MMAWEKTIRNWPKRSSYRAASSLNKTLSKIKRGAERETQRMSLLDRGWKKSQSFTKFNLKEEKQSR